MIALKYLHISFALLSIAGFFLRGLWLFGNSPLFHHKATKILPHIIDTALLVTAVGLVFAMPLNPLEQPWLTAKIAALLVYISLGIYAFRLARNRSQRLCGWLLAQTTAAYIVAVAHTKTPLPFLL
jgi:uncharacterized membrane protein SirB2